MSEAASIVKAARRQLRTVVLDHHRQIDVVDELRTFMSLGEPGRVFLLVGPSGVGKQATVRELRQALLADCAEADLYHAVRLDAEPPAVGTFYWKQFYRSGLEALHDPLVGQQRRASENPSGITEFNKTARFRSGQDYRADFSNALAQRGVRNLLITHGDDLLRRGRPSNAVEQLRTLASLLRPGNLPAFIVISGSYELLHMWRRDTALDRITRIVHMAPYHADNEAEQKEFVRILKGYESALDKYCPTGLLTDNAELLFRASAGCIGWIKALLADSICWMAKRGGETLQRRDIVSALPDHKVISNLQKQIEDGYRVLPRPITDQHVKHGPDTGQKRPKYRRVGERNPARDGVGPEG